MKTQKKDKVDKKDKKEKKKPEIDIEITLSGKVICLCNKNKKKPEKRIDITDSGRLVSTNIKSKKPVHNKLEVTKSGRIIQKQKFKKRKNLEVTQSYRVVPEDSDKNKNPLRITDSGRIVPKFVTTDKNKLEISDSLRIVPEDSNLRKHQLKITKSGHIVPKFKRPKEIEITNSGRIIRKLKGDIDRLDLGKVRRPKWLTTSIAAYFDRKTLIKVTLRDMLIHIILIILASIGALGSRETRMYYLTEAIRNQFVNRHFVTGNQAMKFHEIDTNDKMFNFFSQTMLDSFYSEFYSDPYNKHGTPDDFKKIMYENKLLGVPRIRQVRVQANSCEIYKTFRKKFKKCYKGYSKSVEDKEPFGLGTPTAWIYSDEKTTLSYPYTGKVGTYGAGGYYVDLSTNKNVSKEIIDTLKKNLWITRATRAVFIDFSIYNPNYNYFTICKIIFELPPSGGVLPSHRFRTIRLIYFLTTWDNFVFICNILSLVFTSFIIFEKLREFMFFKLKIFLLIWTYIDAAILILTALIIFKYIAIYSYINAGIELLREYPKTYGNLEYFDIEFGSLFDILALRLFFIYIKIFHYFNFSHTMTQLNTTIKRCAKDITGFIIVFLTAFTTFSIFGYLLFGTEVKNFHSLGLAMFTLLRTILNEFNYQEIKDANDSFGTFFYFTYIFFIFFILLNMFLAIINDNYTEVKNEIAISAERIHLTDVIKEFFKNKFEKHKNKCKPKVEKRSDFAKTLDQIRQALLKCGFKDVEIEMFFQRYNIDPLSTVGDYDVNSLMKQVEKPIGKTDFENFCKINDLIEHDKKLIEIETSITQLIAKVSTLIEQLVAIETGPSTLPPKEDEDVSEEGSLDTITSEK